MLYVCITFAELKRLDILRGDKLLWTSCFKIKEADWEATGGNEKRESRRSIRCKVDKK